MAKKNNRVKSGKAPLIPIESWEHADEMVREIGDLQLNTKKDEISAKAKIDRIKAALAESAKKRQVRIKQLTQSLEAFAVNHRADIKGKSLKLTFGVVGWRKSTSISVKQTTLKLIKQVFTRAKTKHLITIKESVCKDALAKLTDEQLASVEAKRKVKDDFFAEPSVQEAVDYE
ncbi:MAG: host-nuclease inhibitor Gam family protein [Planctomycetes bacterium]|nr:host-nuclease inhibitor Gam family protein [Planctomycetota bacterium]